MRESWSSTKKFCSTLDALEKRSMSKSLTTREPRWSRTETSSGPSPPSVKLSSAAELSSGSSSPPLYRFRSPLDRIYFWPSFRVRLLSRGPPCLNGPMPLGLDGSSLCWTGIGEKLLSSSSAIGV